MSSRNLDADWTWDHTCALFEAREETPTPSFTEIAHRLTQKFGILRTREACVGRMDRVVKESDAALAAAQVHARRKRLADRMREVRDPYHPLPEWFTEPTPVERSKPGTVRADRVEELKRVMIVEQAHRDTKWTAEKAEARRLRRLDEDAAATLRRQEADRERHRRSRALNADLKDAARAEETRLRAKEHRGPQKAVGLAKVAPEARPEPKDGTAVKTKPSRHYRTIWTD